MKHYSLNAHIAFGPRTSTQSLSLSVCLSVCLPLSLSLSLSLSAFPCCVRLCLSISGSLMLKSVLLITISVTLLNTVTEEVLVRHRIRSSSCLAQPAVLLPNPPLGSSWFQMGAPHSSSLVSLFSSPEASAAAGPNFDSKYSCTQDTLGSRGI